MPPKYECTSDSNFTMQAKSTPKFLIGIILKLVKWFTKSNF